MLVKIKKLNNAAVLPHYATVGAAGMDITAISKTFDKDGNAVYGTGLAFEIPEGYVGLLFPRSSVSKTGLGLTNCVGVVDSDYRGEVTLKFKSLLRMVKDPVIVAKIYASQVLTTDDNVAVANIWGNEDYQVGDRVAQMIIIPYPHIEWEEVTELSETKRGDGGYGHTGR